MTALAMLVSDVGGWRVAREPVTPVQRWRHTLRGGVDDAVGGGAGRLNPRSRHGTPWCVRVAAAAQPDGGAARVSAYSMGGAARPRRTPRQRGYPQRLSSDKRSMHCSRYLMV